MPDWAAKRAAKKLAADRRTMGKLRRALKGKAAEVQTDPRALDKIRKRTRDK